ncbi:hypothetical protein GCM10027535_04340 [Mycolicibacterium hippocampi]|uniref:Uncharacterized protein n=1 Tax=Mycolicibacterium hippocampi TaxID=659824 RepID=A0A7I9ZJ22_9MYCO|nr:hypothetical protein MHIP_11700 [Mycolicibacterium hippocampi]
MHRRIMQEAFTRPRLTGYVKQVGPSVRSSIPKWPTGSGVRLYPLLKDLTRNVATDVFMGGRGKEDSGSVNRAFVATVRAASAIVRAPLPGTRYPPEYAVAGCWRSISPDTYRRPARDRMMIYSPLYVRRAPRTANASLMPTS